MLSFLNSLLKPVIYAWRMKQFRFDFVELLFRTVNTADTEEIEMRFFSVPNAVVRVNRVKADQAQQDVYEENV